MNAGPAVPASGTSSACFLPEGSRQTLQASWRYYAAQACRFVLLLDLLGAEAQPGNAKGANIARRSIAEQLLMSCSAKY